MNIRAGGRFDGEERQRRRREREVARPPARRPCDAATPYAREAARRAIARGEAVAAVHEVVEIGRPDDAAPRRRRRRRQARRHRRRRASTSTDRDGDRRGEMDGQAVRPGARRASRRRARRGDQAPRRAARSPDRRRRSAAPAAATGNEAGPDREPADPRNRPVVQRPRVRARRAAAAAPAGSARRARCRTPAAATSARNQRGSGDVTDSVDRAVRRAGSDSGRDTAGVHGPAASAKTARKSARHARKLRTNTGADSPIYPSSIIMLEVRFRRRVLAAAAAGADAAPLLSRFSNNGTRRLAAHPDFTLPRTPGLAQ